MIDVSEARKIVRAHVTEFGIESIPLNKCIGRILKETVIADRDLPPYDRVTMDGIAIDIDEADISELLFLEAIAAAGAPQIGLLNHKNAVEVMTGAILPLGCNAVVRYEDLNISENKVRINTQVKNGQNIHKKGEDRHLGEELLFPGNKISAAEIGVAASVGKTELTVSKLPTVMIISTGDELVEIDKKPLAHQIRKSNVYRIAASLNRLGLAVETDHLNDDYNSIVRVLKDYLNQFDIIILSGGVSKGKFDFLPKALEELGVKKLFHKIAQRPGKPFWFGKKDNCTVFALPGNPVSSFMCTHIYLMDWLRRSLGLEKLREMRAILGSDVDFKPDLTYFLEVDLSFDTKGQLWAHPMKGNGSGDLANLLRADAFIELTRGHNSYKKGGVYPVHLFRDL